MSSSRPARRVPHPKPHIDVEEAARLLAAGLTYVDIGAKLGFRASSIRRKLLEHGVRPEKPRSSRCRRWGEKLYAVWKRMRRTGAAREIAIGGAWSAFDEFYAWARASGYRPGLVLARIEESGPFRPSNCRWEPRGRRPRKERAPAPRTAKRLTERQWKRAETLHVDEGRSCYAVARALGVAHGTILRGLRDRGVYREPAAKLSGTPAGKKLQGAWLHMRARCNDPNDAAYVYYGAKGARVCRAWDDFEAFYRWALEAGWKPGLCLTRSGRARVFSPANCRWVTRAEAARAAHHPTAAMPPRWTITAFGVTQGPTAWSRDRRCAVSLAGLLRRLRSGWTSREALTTPPQGKTGPWRHPRLVTAFGETKSLTEWVKDRRCSVSPVTLGRRLERGMDPEEAVRARAYRARG